MKDKSGKFNLRPACYGKSVSPAVGSLFKVTCTGKLLKVFAQACSWLGSRKSNIWQGKLELEKLVHIKQCANPRWVMLKKNGPQKNLVGAE